MEHWMRTADYWLQIVNYLVWFPLIVLVISAALRAGVRRYPLIFACTVVVLLTAVAQVPTSVAFHRGRQAVPETGQWYQVLHAVSQGIYYPLTLVTVANLIYKASAKITARHLIRRVLMAGVPLFVLVSFAIHYNSHVQVVQWMTPLTRDVTFCATVLDLVLWALLLASPERDHTLLLLAGGFGINFAGDAICDALRSIALRIWWYPVWASADLLAVMSNIGWLYIWWQALRRAQEPVKEIPAYSNHVATK